MLTSTPTNKTDFTKVAVTSSLEWEASRKANLNFSFYTAKGAKSWQKS